MILKTQMHTDSEWKFYDFEEIEWKTNYKCIHHEFSKKLNCDVLTLENQNNVKYGLIEDLLCENATYLQYNAMDTIFTIIIGTKKNGDKRILAIQKGLKIYIINDAGVIIEQIK